MSIELGSDTELVRLIAVPTTPFTGAPLILAVGGTLETLIDVWAEPAPPSLSVTVSVTA